MKTVVRVVGMLFATISALAAFIMVGFRIRPAPFSPLIQSRSVGTVDIPPDLPPPVRRYLQASVGNKLQVVQSFLMVGHASIRRGWLWMPVRYWVAHVPGQHFRRHMEITWYGIPVVRGTDEYINGRGMTTVAGERLIGAHVDQAANLMLWAEAVMMPSLFITDSRLRWETIDDDTARLYVPFEAGEDSLTVHFADDTGFIKCMTAMRYKDEGEKLLWTVEFLDWHAMNGGMFPTHLSVTWSDEGQPWSYWHTDAIAWNTDLVPYLADVELPLLDTNTTVTPSTDSFSVAEDAPRQETHHYV